MRYGMEIGLDRLSRDNYLQGFGVENKYGRGGRGQTNFLHMITKRQDHSLCLIPSVDFRFISQNRQAYTPSLS